MPGEMEVYSQRGMLRELLGQDFHYPIVTSELIRLFDLYMTIGLAALDLSSFNVQA